MSDPFDDLHQARCAQRLADLVNALPTPQLRRVAHLLLLSESEPTHAEVAAVLGVTRQRVTQLLDEARGIMRRAAKRQGFGDVRAYC